MSNTPDNLDKKTKEVEELYTLYPFPGKINFVEKVFPERLQREGTAATAGIAVPCIGISHVPDILHYVFNGCWDKKKKMRILVAGGGTGQHTYWLSRQLEHYGYEYEIIHFDLSPSAIKTAQHILGRYSIKNVKFVLGSLLELDKFKLGKFDYIDCYGVIHHTADPSNALTQLSNSLEDDGGMGIMLYGKYGRQGVYRMQEIMKLTQGGLDEKISFFKELIESVPHSNPFRGEAPEYQVKEGFQSSDENIVDTILHVQDIPFTVDAIYDLCNQAGVKVIEFLHQYSYDPASYFKDKDSSCLKKILSMQKRSQYSFGELMCSSITRHEFFVKKSTNKKNTVMTLKAKPMEGITPIRRANVLHPGGPFSISIGRCTYHMGTLPPSTKNILQHIDNKSSLAEIYDAVASKGYPGDKNDFLSDFETIYDIFRKMSWMTLQQTKM
jgi:SAM-dependent methyltransferase